MPIINNTPASRASNVTTTAPTVNDDLTRGYDVGSVWVDSVTGTSYTCISNTIGAAQWKFSTIYAGDAINISGSTISVKYDNAGIGIDVSNQLEVKNAGVANAKLADMTANTIKGRSVGIGAPEDLTALQAKTVLALVKGDVGLGNVDNTADTAKAIAGDVTGTLGASTVARLQGLAMLPTAPAGNQVIAWNGTAWAPANSSGLEIDSKMAAAAVITSTTSTIPVDLAGMTLTTLNTAARLYYISFSCAWSSSDRLALAHFAIVVNGVTVDSRVVYSAKSASVAIFPNQFQMQWLASLTTGSIVKIQYWTDAAAPAATLDVSSRNLILKDG